MLCDGCPFTSDRLEDVSEEELREGAPLSCHQTHSHPQETRTCEGYKAFMAGEVGP